MIRHLYVHVPFCLRRCSYCDFAVQAVNAAPTSAWLDAVRREVALVTDGRSTLDTIYVGGGTPSLIGAEGMHGLAGVLRDSFDWNRDAEWTAEANPETMTRDVAYQWREAGVNRISLGAQTFNEEALRWMGRVHGADGPPNAVRAIRDAGIDNISLDLIFGLPDRFQRDWNDDLQRIIDLDPQHVSLYGLTAEKATPLGRWVAEGREVLADEDRYADEYLLAVDMLTAAGFEHYEVPNFAKPGLASRHNQAYWKGVPYLGLGPGAHSYVPPVRYWNVRDWNEYARRLSENSSPRSEEEVVEPESASLEKTWLGLRTSDGLQLDRLNAAQLARIAEWERRGLARISEKAVRLSSQGWLLLDRLAVELEI